MLKFVPLLLFLYSCALGPGNFQSRHSADLGGRQIRRIAVFPADAGSFSDKIQPASQVPQALLANLLHSTMSPLPSWQIVSDREVKEVGGMISREAGEGVRARRLGELVYADAVILTRVIRYQERVGEEWGAKSPASVAFVVDLWDVRRGDLAWTARFDETQRALSENLFTIGEFTQRGGRWLKAEELVLEGVKKAVNRLHQTLYRRPAL